MATINLSGDDGSTAEVINKAPVVFKLTSNSQPGAPGAPGATPQLTIGTVTTLPAGSPASVTVTGTKENPVLNFNLPQGAGSVTNLQVTNTAHAQSGLSASGLPALTGSINGSNTAFTTPDAVYAAGTLEVYNNGVLQVLGDAITETSPATGVFTFATAPETGDQLYVTYQLEDLENIPEIGGGGADGVTETYVQNYVSTAFASLITSYPNIPAVQQMIVDRQTANQVSNAIAQALIQYQANVGFKVDGANHQAFLSPTTPTGVPNDFVDVTSLKVNSQGNLWFKSATIAQQPSTPDTPVPYDAQADLSLAALGYKAMHIGTDNVASDHATPALSGAGALARALTIAVIAKDRVMYEGLRDAAIDKFQRKLAWSGQTTMLNSFANTFDITNNVVTDWTVDSGYMLSILGSVIRAWNLWNVVKDKDLASGIAYDIKNDMVQTDEGRAYLVVPSSVHTYNGNKVWQNDLTFLSPVIFRMAKTFTGDTIFDQLVNGTYDVITKGQALSNAGLIPCTVGYTANAHSVHLLVDGQNGWVGTVTPDFVSASWNLVANLYEDYKIFAEARALTILRGPLLTFFKTEYDTNAHIYGQYNLAGTAQNTTQTSIVYRNAYLLLSLATSGTTAATVKAAKIPYPTAVSGDNHYYNGQIIGVTAASDRDLDGRNWVAESQIIGNYQELAVYGNNPNAGTTSPPGTTPPVVTPPTTTPPPATGGGVDVGSFYSYGAAPNLTQTQRQTIARDQYDKFKAWTFVDYFCNPDGTNHQTMPNGWKRVAVPDEVNDNPWKTVSEGIGYGMLCTAFMGNPTLPVGIYDSTAQSWFDGFWKYYKGHMNAHGLMNWKQTSDGTTVGTGGATDGDEDAAFALVMAHRIWGSAGAINYGAEAATLINAIRDWEFVPTTGHGANANVMTNGDQWGFDNPTYFADYFRPAWYREFYKHTGDSRWLDIINVNYPLAQGSFYNGTGNAANINGLVTDIDRSGNRVGSPILGYNNIRYPFSIAADYVWNGPATNALAHDMPNRMVTRAKVVYGTNPTTPAPDPIAHPGVYNPYSGTSGIVAEPSIDYAWWNGTYRNSAYVQAFGVAGIVDAAHTAWTASCMQYLQADTEQNYFGRSLATISAMLMAGMMNPASPATPGTSTPGSGTPTTTPPPVVVPPPTTNLPTGSLTLASMPLSSITTYRDTLGAGTKKDRFNWLTSIPMGYWSGIEWDPNCTGVGTYITAAVAAGKVPQVLSYSIPGRDLGQYSAGGASNRAGYETWIGKMATAIGNNKCIMEYEPDSLPQSLSLSDDLRTGRYSMMKWAVQYLKSHCPNLYLYMDVGHPAWLAANQAADVLRQVGVESANGFGVNVSNFRPDAECISYGQQICANLNMPGVRFIYDSGRNGGNPPESWQWANPPSRQFGKLPQFGNTGIDKCDGWLWWKVPGESDGNSGDGAPVAGALWSTYLYNDSKGDNITTGTVSTSSGMLQRPPTPGVQGGV